MTAETDVRLKQRLKTLAVTKADAPTFGLRKNTDPKKKGRTRERTPTFRVGRIVYSGRNEVPCIVKDCSEKGAKVVLEGEAALPPEVCLCITQSGQRRRAKVIWQDGREAGLSFDLDGEC